MTARFKAARDFAITAHGEQKYGEDKPYVYHLDKACDVLRRFGFTEEADPDFFDAMILHDVVEDTPVGCFELGGIFEEAVVILVFAVTNEQGRNRAERHVKTYIKIFNTVNAIILKLADRIANVEEGGKYGMYKKEHLEFLRILGNAKQTRSVEVAAMWDHLNKLMKVETLQPDPAVKFSVQIPYTPVECFGDGSICPHAQDLE